MKHSKRSLMRGMLVTLVAFGSIAWVTGAAAADGDGPPKAQLRINDETLQRGRLLSFCWTSPSSPPGTYVTGCGDSMPGFPRARMVSPGTHLTIRILDSRRPRQFAIRAWKKIDRYGDPVGTGTELSFKQKRAHLESGEAWDYSVVLPDPSRHYYVSVAASWRDEDRAGPDQATWTFHVRTSA